MSDYTFTTTDPKIKQRTIKLFNKCCVPYPDNPNIMTSLVIAGVDVKAVDNGRRNLLHFAAYNSHTEVCALLIAQSADIHAQDKKGETPLHWAAHKNNTEVCTLLIAQSADVNARNIISETPLRRAVWAKNPEVVKTLLAHGANIWAEDKWDKTPLDSDKTNLLNPYKEKWEKVLEEVKNCDYGGINSTQDIYHLASVMQPADPKNIPHPKEFIRILFQQYLPHEKKFNAMYEEIFSQQRAKPFDLQSARQQAAKSRGVVI